MLLLMLERDMPIDLVLNADTGMEYPEMHEHLKQVDEHLYRERGIHITRLKSPKSFEYMMFDEPKQKASCIANRQLLGVPCKGNGWPGIHVRWCTGQLKTHLISREVNRLRRDRPCVQYIQAKLSEGKGAGYERWAKVFNLKQMAQTINFLKENGDMDFDELSRRAEAASEKCSALTEKLKRTEARMSEVEELKKQVINYLRTRETFRAYKASGYSKRYLAEHEQEILLHRAAKKAFNDRGLKKLPTVKALQAEYAALLAEKRAAYPAYREARDEMKKLLTYRANAEAILNVEAKADGKQKEHEQR